MKFLVCPYILFYYYILFFENKKVWAYEQLHFSEQLVYKEYLNKMQFEVACMQFEAILSKAIWCNFVLSAILTNENAILPYKAVGRMRSVDRGGCDNM